LSHVAQSQASFKQTNCTLIQLDKIVLLSHSVNAALNSFGVYCSNNYQVLERPTRRP
jgi:hypothetical protein